MSISEALGNELEKYHLRLSLEGLKPEKKFLSRKGLNLLAEKLLEVGETSQLIGRMIIARKGVEETENKLVQRRRGRVMADYDGEIFRSEVWPDPPVKG